ASDRGLALLEGVEDFLNPFRLDAHPRIGNPNINLLRRGVDGFDRDAAFFRSEFHAVLDQVPKDLLQTRRIAFDVRIGGAKTKFHFEIFGSNVLAANFVSTVEDLVHANRLKAQLQFAFRDACDVEQIVNQVRFQLDVASNDIERLANGWRIWNGRFQFSDHRDDWRKGIA